jgi:hypothetical protein
VAAFVVQTRTCRVQIYVDFHNTWRLSQVLMFMSDQSVQMRSADKQQEFSLLRSRVILEASAVEPRYCKFPNIYACKLQSITAAQHDGYVIIIYSIKR